MPDEFGGIETETRPDGTPKGPGFFGSLKRPDGNVSTEISIGVGIDGIETLIPALVPSLTPEEIQSLLQGDEPSKEIVDKAVEHAMQRKAEGKSIFAESETETDEFGGTIVHPPTDQKWEKPLPLGQRLIDNYARPVFQGLGSAAGIVLGGGGGGLAGSAVAPGPGTATGVMVGAVAGESLGYAIGDEVADLMQEWFGYYEPLPLMLNLQEAAENVGEGATYATGGYALGPAAKLAGKGASKIPGVGKITSWISSLLPKTDKQAQQAAGEVLAAFTNKGPMVSKNIEEARAFEELIGGGFKFDLGQLTGDVNVVKFMREGIDDAGDLAVAQAEQAAINTKAINNFIKRTKGKGTTEDLIKPLSAEKGSVTEAEEIAKRNLERQQAVKASQMGPMDVGTTIRTEMEAGETAAREKASKMFDKVPNQTQVVDDLYDEFNKIMRPKYRSEGRDKFPDVLKREIKAIENSLKGGKKSAVTDDVLAKAKADIAKKEGKIIPKAKAKPVSTGEPTMSLRDIQGLRSEILEDLRTAKDKGLPRSLRARLAKAVEVIDTKLGGVSGEKVKTPAQELQAAQKYFREEVIEKYGKGSAGAVLRGEDAVQSAAVAGKFFKPGPAGEQAAEEFIKVMGDNTAAKTALREHINQSMLDKAVSPSTGEITKAALNRWLKSHRLSLKKLGMTGNFDSLVKARAIADKALASSKEFEKSAASRVLNADVNDVVKQAFSKGSKKKAAEDLMLQLKAGPNIKGPAIRDKTGKIHTGISHPHIYDDLQHDYLKTHEYSDDLGLEIYDDLGLEDGFINRQGNFVTRKQVQKELKFWPETETMREGVKAVAGLQNAMVDEILTEIPLEGKVSELLISSKMAAQFRKYDAALKVVFKDNPEKLKAMHVVRKAVKALEYKTGESAGEGTKYATNVVTRMALIYGHSTAAAADIARKTTKVLKGMSKAKIHKYINRGILDPETAFSLMQAIRGKTEKRITQGITNSLIRLGLISKPKKKEVSQPFTGIKGKH